MKYYCPDCKEEVEVIKGCGAVNYFCDKCKKLISSKVVIKEEEIKEE